MGKIFVKIVTLEIWAGIEQRAWGDFGLRID
jgi:hypothetical protein